MFTYSNTTVSVHCTLTYFTILISLSLAGSPDIPEVIIAQYSKISGCLPHDNKGNKLNPLTSLKTLQTFACSKPPVPQHFYLYKQHIF